MKNFQLTFIRHEKIWSGKFKKRGYDVMPGWEVGDGDENKIWLM